MILVVARCVGLVRIPSCISFLRVTWFTQIQQLAVVLRMWCYGGRHADAGVGIGMILVETMIVETQNPSQRQFLQFS